MKFQIRAAITAALVSAGVALAPAGAASAAEGDQRACVAQVEINSLLGLYQHTDGTRATIEARWEVHSRGTVSLPGLGNAIAYKRCGYDMSRSFVAVSYDRNNVATGGGIITQ